MSDYGQAEFEQDQMDRGRDRNDEELSWLPDDSEGAPYYVSEGEAHAYEYDAVARAERYGDDEGVSWRDWGAR